MEWAPALSGALQPNMQPSRQWNFVLAEQLAKSKWPYATIHQIAEDLAVGDHERFAYLYVNFFDVLPRLLADEWVTLSGSVIALTFKGKIAANLPKDAS